MVKLTEDMVSARSRGADITTLRNLNCWGACLTDVSLLRRMKNLEVIAFSVNQIASLSDFTDCSRLQELYLRGNQISDLNQLCYLQSLPALRQLLLKENPVESAPLYRETVLRALPWLHKLDDQAVGEGEVDNARRVGRELVHPLHAAGSANSSRSSSPPPHSQDCPEEYYPEELQPVAASVYDNAHQQFADSEGDSPASSPRTSLRRSPPPPTPPPARQDYYEPEPEAVLRTPRYNYEEIEEDQNSCDRTYRQVQDMGASLSRLSTHKPLRSPGIRSSNVLSSVLLLIKELDVTSLEVVLHNVESRIRELCD